MHVFPDNKRYVGLTKQSPTLRWGINGSGYKKQPVYDYIKLYGWDSIDHIIVADNLNCEDATKLEQNLISKYNTTNPEYGYNIKTGGEVGSIPWSKYNFNGNTYSSEELALLSDKGLSGHDITNRINTHGWSVERALNQEKDSRQYSWEYDGKIISSQDIVDMAKDNGVILTKDDVNCRINRGWDIERVITQPKGKKKQPFGIGERKYEYNGKLYNSYELTKLSPYNLKSTDITNRINHHGWSVEKAINTPKKGHNVLYEYHGKKYKSVELCQIYPELKLTHNNITDRLRAGWSVERAVETPKQKKL